MMSRRVAVTALIAVLGALGGAVAALAMNVASSSLSGPPGTPGYVLYQFKVVPVSILGAVVAPLVAWTMLRGAPIWRAVVEPSAAALVAGAVSMMVAPSAYLWAIPAAAALASFRLHRRYPQEGPELIESEVGPAARMGG